MTLPYVFGNYFIPSLSTKSRSSWLPTGFFHMTISQAHKTQHFQSLFPQCAPCSVFPGSGSGALSSQISRPGRQASPLPSASHPVNTFTHSQHVQRGSIPATGTQKCVKQVKFPALKELKF